MFRDNRWKPALAAAVALFALMGGTAQAQVKPFKVSGGGVASYFPLPGQAPATHFAVGHGTELGNYYGEGAFVTTRLTGPASAEFNSTVPFVFVAANGDRLACHYGRTDFGAAHPGQVNLFPAGDGRVFAVFVAEFNPVPALSTGRFSKVIGGSFTMVAVSEPFVVGAHDPTGYSWSGEGTLEFAVK